MRPSRRAPQRLDPLTPDTQPVPQDSPADLIRIAEAVLFASGEPVRIPDAARALGVRSSALKSAMTALAREYDDGGRGVCVRVFGDSAQMCTRPAFAQTVRRTLQPIARQPLSHHVLETLAVVAYHQPVTRGEIDQMRGVKSDSSVHTLLSRGLIRELGRRATLGRPMEFGTTDLFLRHFGLSQLDELPAPRADGGVNDPNDPKEERISV
ncbi:MAG: SMC-Scp complex subunit ScpB [Oscillospiraceae bacterium]|jgi:segregation and condensation protein B|nr:SMC-Scp complex subunit ScpB [Oscillospiraceae bacterium]